MSNRSRQQKESGRLCGVESSSLAVAARCISVQVVPDRPYRCKADRAEWTNRITKSACLSRESWENDKYAEFAGLEAYWRE